ncbi:FdtA/QdtA family cupin domain-containing protein [Vibrio lentus]
MNKLINIIELKLLGDERGNLVALEEGEDIPFRIKRSYYIFNTKEGIARGFHAHKELQQVAVCVSGSCQMIMDDGSKRASIKLNSPTKGIFIDKMQWHEMHDFTKDCILLVLASDKYQESDYIRNYEEFLTCVRQE